MFRIRMKQLSRKISNHNQQTTLQDSLKKRDEIQNLIEEGHFNRLYQILNQIPLLGQLFARSISWLATENPNKNFFAKIDILIHFLHLLITELTKHSIEIPIDNSDYKFTSKELTRIQEDLRTLQKNTNSNITSLDRLVDFLLEGKSCDYSHIRKATNWNQLLSRIFDVNICQDNSNVEEIQHIHIKEQILANNLQGELITRISRKYDGILTYCMSLLTIISSSEYSQQVSPALNKILDKLGASTKIILIQSRLKNNISRYQQINHKITQVFEQFHIDCDYKFPLEISSNFPYSKQILPDTLQQSLEKENSKEYQNLMIKLWHDYLGIYEEFQAIFSTLENFLDDIIKDTNSITADLFAKGFKASLPAFDVEKCETAGIHIKDLIQTSTNQKITLEDDYLDLKVSLIRKFEHVGSRLKKILIKKVNEETSNKSLIASERIFVAFYSDFENYFVKIQQFSILQGFHEGIILGTRILYSSILVFENLLSSLTPIIDINYNKENLSKFNHLLQMLPAYQGKLEKIVKLASLLNQIALLLLQLNRGLLLDLGKKHKMLLEPEMIKSQLKSIPSALKREKQQRLISVEDYEHKLEKYEDVNNLLEKLNSIPIDQRMFLQPYDEDSFRQIL